MCMFGVIFDLGTSYTHRLTGLDQHEPALETLGAIIND